MRDLLITSVDNLYEVVKSSYIEMVMNEHIKVSTISKEITIKNRNETYTVLFSCDGDHIVCKHNKRDTTHTIQIEYGTDTWLRVTHLASTHQP